MPTANVEFDNAMHWSESAIPVGLPQDSIEGMKAIGN